MISAWSFSVLAVNSDNFVFLSSSGIFCKIMPESRFTEFPNIMCAGEVPIGSILSEFKIRWMKGHPYLHFSRTLESNKMFLRYRLTSLLRLSAIELCECSPARMFVLSVCMIQ